MRKITFLLVALLLIVVALPAAAQEGDDNSDTMRSFREFLGASGEAADNSAAEPETDEPETAPPVTSTGGLPETLTSATGSYQTAISELQDAGVIPGGGSLVFQENRVFANARGTGYLSLAENAGTPNVVMAGTIDFTSTNTELESCGLVARIGGTPNNVGDFLVVGVTNQEFAFALDTALPQDQGVAAFADGLENGAQHHVLFIAQDDALTVYVNGELALVEFPIDDRSGFYGLRITSDPATVTDCVANNVWAYRIGSGNEACELIANSNVNKRSGPGTSFDVAGQLTAGQVNIAVGQATDSAGFTWYEMEDGAFVREDVISAQGACSSLPQSD